MKKIPLLITILCCGLLTSKAQTAETFLEKMYNAYKGKWYKTYTFIQDTEFFRNDSLIRKETWYEAMRFPSEFRIDYGDIQNRNINIWRNDSIYLIRRDTLRGVRPYKNDLLFFSGGIYFFEWPQVKAFTASMGFDLSKSFTTNWNGNPVFVIGATTENETSNQVWLSTQNYQPLRLIRFNNGNKTEIVYDKFIKLGNGWSETKVSFYNNGKLSQVEYYRDCKVDTPLDDRLFSPTEYNKVHWYGKK